MAEWWNTSMAQSSQTMYNDADLMRQVATMPDNMLTSPEEYAKNLKATQAERSGFMGTLGKLWDGVDGALSKIPGWGLEKKFLAYNGAALWAPLDKTVVPAARWIYSEGFSQPFSTLLIQTAKADLNDNYGQLLSPGEWGNAYHEAEHMSPGRVVTNYENVIAASGDAGALSGLFGLTDNGKYTGGATSSEQADIKRQQERFLYDNEYWKGAGTDRNKQNYNRGSGALDFFFVVFGDPTNLAVGGASNLAKAVRSPAFVDDGLGGLVRNYEVINNKHITLGGKGKQTIDQWSTGNATNQFYDWIASPGLAGETKTAAEIAAHPIWGTGRRVNPFKDQWGQVLANTKREDMPLVLRYSLGDSRAATELAAKGSRALDDIGRVSDNRKLVGSTKFDDEMLSYFAGQADTGVTPNAGLNLFEPPFPRPATPGPRQSGWDKRWGPLQAKADLHREALEGIKGVRTLGPAGGINAADLTAIKTWQTSKVKLIDDEINALVNESQPLATLLGTNMGKAPEDIALAQSKMFGTMDRAFRMGSFSVKSANTTAAAKAARNAMDRKGRFAVQGMRKGFYGTPLRVVQSFGDRVPEGRVNHNDSDAPDRVMDMLKQVPALGSEERLALLNKYMAAPDKVAKSKALTEIQSGVIQHMATRVHGLDPEIAGIIDRMIEVGVSKTMSDLTGGRAVPTGQAFSAAERGVGQKTADHVKDGEAWIVAPMAKTQLDTTDTLLPIKEINELIGRNSGAMKVIKRAGGKGTDNILPFVDSFSTIWKATTLLRPAYVPRMISEEWFASAIKFGAMSRMIADPSMGMYNFIRNRGVQMASITGKASYVPTTGKGLESNLAIIRLGDQDVISQVNARRADLIEQIKTANPKDKARLQQELSITKADRIQVNKAMPIVHNRIGMEKELSANLEKDIAGWTSEVEALKAMPDQVSALKADTLRNKIAVAQDDIVEHSHIISEYTDYADEIMRVALASQGKRLFEGQFEAFGRKIPQAFSKEWDHTISRDSLSSENAYQTMYARSEAIDTARAIKTGSWTYVDPTQPNHMAAWQRAINLQFRQDDVFRLVAEDPTGKKAAQWLSTPAGKHHLKDLGGYRSTKELISDVKLTLDKYLPVESLQQKLGRGEEVTEAEIRANIPKGEFPMVHGEEVKYATRMGHKETAASKVDRIVAAGFKRLGAIPSDLMSRHPVYARMFEARMRTIMDQELRFKAANGKGDTLLPAELNAMQAKADVLARKDISQVVYDPKRTTGGEALRFVFPFFSAHMDSLSRWGGLIGEKPNALTPLSQIYNAPVAANMITDDQGNLVGMDGYATKTKIGPDGKEMKVREKVNMNDRVLHLRNPFTTTDNSKGSVPIKLSAINTILPGDPWFNPGSGPLVQIAGSQIAKASPVAGDFLQWAKILPYGPTDVSTAITPKYLRAAWDVWKGEDPDNEEYQKAYLAVYNRKVAEYHETGKKFNPADIEKEAKGFMYLSFLEAWASPGQTKASPITGTKYQFFVDAYSQLREADPQNAKDIFMQRYGGDYFGFTSSLTKSMGIAATHSADAMATKYKDVLDLDPDMAPFIIGNIYNGGAFSRSVYVKQLEQSFGGEWVREKITAVNAIEQNQTEQGWAQYRQVKGVLDSMLLRAGLSSYSQKNAAGLNQMRSNMVANLSAKYPAWGDAFMVTDRGKIPNRIDSFERLVTDERFQNDPMRQGEIAQLQKYLLLRRQFKGELAKQGFKELSTDPMGNPTGKSKALGTLWESNVMKLVNDDTGFAGLYNRYLVNDNLQ